MEEKAEVEEAMAGGGGAADGDGDDVGEGMQCSEHPYRSNPGGICAFCLQEKLGNLLSTAAPNSFFTTTTTAPLAAATSSSTSTAAASAAADVLLLKASSKSVAPRPLGDIAIVSADSPRKKKHFWSFLYHSSSSSSSSTATANADAKINQQQQQQQQQESADGESSSGGSSLQAASSSSFGRKVGRSRSVGCGSRSFSGDFLERISTGFGDCTLRRVESQRETRKRAAAADGKMATQQRNVRESRIKERVRCGGIFRGLGMGSTSSSYWLSSSAEDESSNRIKMSSKTSLRNRNWGWAFASPMRAFKPSSRPANTVASTNISSGTTSYSSSKISNGNPPSSLAVGGGS